MQHQPFINMNKPGKLRRDYNAAAQYKKCFSNNLLAVADLANKLIGTIAKLWERPIFLTARIAVYVIVRSLRFLKG